MQEKLAYIAFNMMEKVGPAGVKSMVEALGSARAAFEVEAADFAAFKVPGAVARAVLAQREGVRPEEELARAQKLGMWVVTPVDAEYPRQLLEIHDPPLALYGKGTLQERDRYGMAIVGTRRPSHYGREVARNLAAQLAQAGITVISGLAAGIDTEAHEGALQGQGRTLAVLGSALDRVYPPSNAGLAERIAERGAVLSEFACGREPDRTTFPIRNRIVSGLSRGTVVVEAGRKSGALHTANSALEQGRTVFAVPGRIDSPASEGTHELLRQGAVLTRHVDDILSEFELLGAGPRILPQKSALRPALSAEEALLVARLEDGELDVDSLIRLSGLTPSQVSVLLLGLEMKRVVRMLPGRVVEMIR